MKIAELIDANPNLLLMLQHFNIDFRVGDMTVWQLCSRYDISENLFVSIAGLYNGFITYDHQPFTPDDLLEVIDFLKRSHEFYRNDKYPEISSYIRALQEKHPSLCIAGIDFGIIHRQSMLTDISFTLYDTPEQLIHSLARLQEKNQQSVAEKEEDDNRLASLRRPIRVVWFFCPIC